MHLKNLQALNFVSIRSARIDPLQALMTEAERSDDKLVTDFIKTSMVETFGWVLLGSLVSYYRPSWAHEYRELVFPRLGKLDDIEGRFKSPLREALFSRPSASFLESVVEDEVLYGVFESSLYISQQVFRSECAASFAAYFSHDNPDTKRLVSTDLQSDEVSDTLAAQKGVPECPSMAAASVFAGFGETIDFLRAIRRLRNRMIALDNGDASRLVRQAAQLVDWRVRFFSRLAEHSIFVQRYLDLLHVEDAALRGEFVGNLGDLAADWQELVAPKRLAAGQEKPRY